MLPSNVITHTVILTDRHGKAMRGKIVYVESICDVHTEMHIMSSDWLDIDSHEAVSITDSEMVDGCYAVFGCESIEGNHWLFKGVFEPCP